MINVSTVAVQQTSNNTTGHTRGSRSFFVRGGPTLTIFLVDGWREDPNTTISGPSWPASEKLTVHWPADDGPTLNAGLVAF